MKRSELGLSEFEVSVSTVGPIVLDVIWPLWPLQVKLGKSQLPLKHVLYRFPAVHPWNPISLEESVTISFIYCNENEKHSVDI